MPSGVCPCRYDDRTTPAQMLWESQQVGETVGKVWTTQETRKPLRMQGRKELRSITVCYLLPGLLYILYLYIYIYTYIYIQFPTSHAHLCQRPQLIVSPWVEAEPRWKGSMDYGNSSRPPFLWVNYNNSLTWKTIYIYISLYIYIIICILYIYISFQWRHNKFTINQPDFCRKIIRKHEFLWGVLGKIPLFKYLSLYLNRIIDVWFLHLVMCLFRSSTTFYLCV